MNKNEKILFKNFPNKDICKPSSGSETSAILPHFLN